MKKASPGTFKLDEATCVFGAGVLVAHIQALMEETVGIRAGNEDIEYIHRARVASRRLRAALPLFQACLPGKKSLKWLKEIRGVTHALGEARDTDVQLERLDTFYQALTDRHLQPGVNRLKLRLQQRRDSLQGPVVKSVTDLQQDQVLDEMVAVLGPLAERSASVYLFTPTLYQHSFQAVHSRLEDLLAYDAIVNQPDKVAELHQMRIAAKWLRYTLETFTPLYANQLKPPLQVVRKAQEELGEIHDCDVWRELLPQFMEEEKQRIRDYFGYERPLNRLLPGIHAFEQDRLQARDAQYEEFVNDWQQWQQEGVWDTLRQTIQVPFLHPDSIYPPPPPVES
jgi:CHAD domain-containing protein